MKHVSHLGIGCGVALTVQCGSWGHGWAGLGIGLLTVFASDILTFCEAHKKGYELARRLAAPVVTLPPYDKLHEETP